MAKNENKSDLNQNKDEKKDVVSAPEKVTTLPHSEKDEAQSNPKKPELPHKESKSIEPPHKKHHGARKFVLFIFLLLLGGITFLAIQLEQTKKLNAESLQKLQAAYDDKMTVLENRVNKLNREVNALKERPLVEQVAGVSENQVNQKISALRDEMNHYLSQLTAETEATDAEETDEIPANETLTEPQRVLSPEIAVLAAGEKKTQEVLLASGAIIVRDLAEQGVSFAYEAEVLQILARGNELAENYVRKMRSFADTGIAGKRQLIRRFDKIFGELNGARVKSVDAPKKTAEEKNWLGKAWAWLKQAVAVKKGVSKPVFVATDDEVAELVHEGRLQDALNALKTNEKYAKIDSQPLNVWKEQTERYLEFSHAASGLIMNALANIRLKELEHAAE